MWMHRPRPGGIRLEGDDFHRDDFHTYPSSRHSGATFVPRCSCTVSGAGCSRHRIPPRSANVFMHLASPWAGARGHGCVRLVIRVNVRILNASWWMIVMGGHEKGQVSYFQLIFRIFLFLSSLSFFFSPFQRPYVARVVTRSNIGHDSLSCFEK